MGCFPQQGVRCSGWTELSLCCEGFATRSNVREIRTAEHVAWRGVPWFALERSPGFALYFAPPVGCVCGKCFSWRKLWIREGRVCPQMSESGVRKGRNMAEVKAGTAPLWRTLVGKVSSSLRRMMLQILSAGPIPRHVAIIMDGNRRFADRAQMDRTSGHLFGYDRLIETLENCFELGVKYLTVYAFSIDNFKRSPEEVAALMDLMQEKLEMLAEKERLLEEYGVKVQVCGDLSLLPERVVRAAERAMAATRHNESAVFNICVAYTSSHEMVEAIQQIRDGVLAISMEEFGRNVTLSSQKVRDINMRPAKNLKVSDILDGITETDIDQHLYTRGCPAPDLLIRTSGETRLSNFLMWQSCFSQLAFCRVLWPQFSLRHLFWILLDWQIAQPALQAQQSS